MPRNSSGTQVAANGPYIAGQVADPNLVNARFADEEAEITDSLSRSGKGGMLAPVRGVDGTVAAPAYSFTSEVGTGAYRAGAGDLRISVSGVDALKLASGGVNGPISLSAGTTAVQVTVAGGFLLLQGNRIAADVTLADVVADSSVARTAGFLFKVRNAGIEKLGVDYQGLLTLTNQAAAIQPASIWTAITPATGYTASADAAYCKNASGEVRLKGTITSLGTGAVTMFTLPTGFRPAVARHFICSDGVNTQSNSRHMVVDIGGTVSYPVGVLANGASTVLDGISFLAEA